MKKAIIISVGIVVALGASAFFIWHKVSGVFALSQPNVNSNTTSSTIQLPDLQVQGMIDARRKQSMESDSADPFGDDGIVRILFIGLDNRIGQTSGHCDAIQMVEINKTKQTITITAVPRGTYAPLPGKNHLPTDYYVSKSCEVGGLEYGVKQIERILGQKADYLIFIGFSQAMGIFRQLDLPADETMQWLRVRQGYAIGEPQRARNHSTFIKQMLIKYAPQMSSKVAMPVNYVLFKLLHTDLTFNQSMQIAGVISKIDPTNNPGRIQLSMRPPYDVKDISYNPDQLNERIDAMIKPIARNIPEGAYTGVTQETRQKEILADITKGLEDKEFVTWAYSNYLWLQIIDDAEREKNHYAIIEKYIVTLTDDNEKRTVITDYIIEMENLGMNDWADKGKELLKANTIGG